MIKDRGAKTIHGQSFFSDCPSERAEEEETFPTDANSLRTFSQAKGGPVVKTYAFLSFPFYFRHSYPIPFTPHIVYNAVN